MSTTEPDPLDIDAAASPMCDCGEPKNGHSRPACWETAQPNRTTADVLRDHQPTGAATGTDGGWLRHCMCTARVETLWDRDGDDWERPFAQHQADMLAAAGLLATAEALGNALDDARHDGYADALDAIREGATETRLRAALAEHDAQVLRDAAKAIGHAPGCHPDPDRDPYVGCMCRVSLIYARADRIAGGAT